MVAAEGRRTRGLVGRGLSTGSTGLPTQLGMASVACTAKEILQNPTVGCGSRYKVYWIAHQVLGGAGGLYGSSGYCSTHQWAVGAGTQATWKPQTTAVVSTTAVGARTAVGVLQ